MATVINIKTMQILESVDTAQFIDNPEWIVNPSLPKDTSCQYWKYDPETKTIIEMTESEKKDVDTNIKLGETRNWIRNKVEIEARLSAARLLMENGTITPSEFEWYTSVMEDTTPKP